MPTFRPPEHIRRRADFEQIYEHGAKVTGRFMTLFVRPTQGRHARLGIAATRKIGGAVTRNRAKRLARELFRHHKPPSGVDLVVVPRREFLDASFVNLEREFDGLLERAARAPARPPRTQSRRPRGARADSRV
jgi:ribonuclease P protein component